MLERGSTQGALEGAAGKGASEEGVLACADLLRAGSDRVAPASTDDTTATLAGVPADAASSAKRIEEACAAARLFLTETVDDSEIARLSRTEAQLGAASVDEAYAVTAMCGAPGQ